MAPRKSEGEGKGKTTAPTRQTRSMDRKTRSQTQRNSSGGSSSSSKLMTFESPEKRKKRKSKAKEEAEIKQEKEEDEEEAMKPEEEGDDDSEHKRIVIEHCKMVGGESSRNRDAMNEDRISELPEALLLHILSSVPTKDVIATSALSKRWRSVWKMVPTLKFVSENDNVSSGDVYRLLLLHKAPVLESLHLEIEDTKGRLDIGILIAIAFPRLRKLVLNLYSDDQETVRFPSVLCGYNNTLEVLELMSYVLLDFPSRVCFNALRELHLFHVEFKDEASVCNLLSGCPRLQDLVVERYSNFDVGTYTIAVPSLQRLTIEEDSSQDMFGGGYLINAPSLKYLNIEGLYGIDFCLIENAPELVEAKIEDVSHIDNENILASLTSAKRLSFDFPLEIKYPTGSIFYQLLSLELRINDINGWNLLLFMLDSSPKLQILKLDSVSNDFRASLHFPLEIKYPTGSIFYQLVSLELNIDEINGWNLLSFMLDSSPKLQSLKLESPYREECPVGWEWNQPKCLLLHLETLVWTRYRWEREDEKQVAIYILKNARQLKKAAFYTRYIQPKELEKRREMLNELASVARGSTSCDLVFKSE